MAVPDEGGEVRGFVTMPAEWLGRTSAARAADLSEAEIDALLGELAGCADVGRHADGLRPVDGGRAWECLHRDAHVDVWIIAWAPGADTGWHDHDSSSGAMRVVEGTVTQEQLRWADDPERRAVPAGEALTFGADHVHRVTVAAGRAVTLHGYSPPLRRMGRYSFDELGTLRRRTVDYDGVDQAALAS